MKLGEVRRGLEFLLPPGVTLRGRVVERGAGSPVEGALVEVLAPGNPRLNVVQESHGSTKTDHGGTFELEGLGAGAIRLQCTHEEYVETITDPIEARAGETIEDVYIDLSRGGGVDGYAIDRDGSPIEEANASAMPADWRGGRVKWAVTDPKGYFRIEGLAPGKQRVHVEPRTPGARPERLAAVAFVEEGRMTRVEFAPFPEGGGTVRGQVSARGKGIPGVWVHLSPMIPTRDPDEAFVRSGRYQTETDRDGSFRIGDVPPGEARVTASGSAMGFLMSEITVGRTVQVRSEEEVVCDFELPEGEIAGRVVRASDGEALPGVSVYTRPAGNPRQPGEYHSSSTQTDANGRYGLHYVPPGEYFVRAGGRIFGIERPTDELVSAEKGPVSVAAGSPAVVDFSLERGGSALVEVLDPGSHPAERLQVRVVPAGWRGESLWPSDTAFTDAYGVARIKGLSPGHYVATVAGGTFAAGFSDPAPVRAGEETRFRIQLEVGTRVRVRVEDQSGERVPNARLAFRDASGRPIVSRRLASREERPEDVGFEVGVLVPGDYTLEITAAGYREKSFSLRVGATPPEDIVVRLEPDER